jgi:diguanylate cyclase (GGDEF)-like protein/PAS domain S-box-containing protein
MRAVLDALPAAVATYRPRRDADGAIVDFVCTYLNAVAASGLGPILEAKVDRPLLASLPGDRDPGIFDLCSDVAATGRPRHLAVPGTEGSGGPRASWDVSVFPFQDEIIVLERDGTKRATALHSLKESEDRFRLLAENASDIILLVNLDGTLEWVSPSVTTILGWHPAELVGSLPWGLVHPDDRDAAVAALAAAADVSHPPEPIRLRFRTVAGDYLWMAGNASHVDEHRIVVSYRLVDEQVKAEQALEESESRYRLMVENAMDLVFSLDMKAILQWMSPSVTSLLGFEPSELVGRSGAVIVKPEDLPLLLDAATAARAGKPASARIRLVCKDGTDRWVEAVPRGLYDDAGELVGGVIGVRDIGDEVAAREALEHEIEFDDLTGLAKRSVALDRIQEILDTRRTDGWALLCAGIDGMTAVNQAYTYAAGDEVLRAVADRLIHATGAADRVARIAGDEFVILMRDIVTPTDAANAAERILAALRGPVEVGDTTIDVTACVGIAIPSGRDAEALLRDAAAAMRQAARKGSDRWEFLDGNVAADTRQVLAVQASLRDAIEDGRIQPWLMPVASLADGTVCAYEALVRWVHADGSVTTPDAFLDVAERSGLILKIDRTILVQVLDALGTLPHDVPVAVNVSAASLSSGTFCEDVIRELERTGQDPSRLHLEVTETALFDVTAAIQETMRRLADVGVAWWVDDFGTGFSSISHLRDLPISGLKLDQSFTAGITSDDSHASRLSQGLAGLAEGLGLQTIAEGVETVLQARVLAEHGWQMGQGWLYGRPAPLTT